MLGLFQPSDFATENQVSKASRARRLTLVVPVDIARLLGVRFDEVAPWLDLITHELTEHLFDLEIEHRVKFHLHETTILGIHRGLFEVLGVHFTKTFKAGDLGLFLLVPLETLEDFVALFLSHGIVAFVVSDLHNKKGRLGKEYPASFHERLHVPLEESEEQGANVLAVHVSVGHDNDLPIAKLGEIELDLLFFGIASRILVSKLGGGGVTIAV